MYKYGAKLLRVVDGDTADVMIDLGFLLSNNVLSKISAIFTF